MNERWNNLNLSLDTAVCRAFFRLTRSFDEKAVKACRQRLSFQPSPFVLPLQRIEPNAVGYVDIGRRNDPAAFLVVRLVLVPFAVIFLLLGTMTNMVIGWDRACLLGFSIACLGFSWFLTSKQRHEASLARVLAYHEKHDELAIVLVRRKFIVHRVKCSGSEAKLMIHKATLSPRPGALPLGSCFFLAVYVGGERFAIAAQGKKEQLLDLWARVPQWLKRVDAGEGEPLELVGDRKLW
jgi:hypothetical protein